MFVAFARIDSETRKDEKPAPNLFMSTCFNLFLLGSKNWTWNIFFYLLWSSRSLPLAFDISLECLVQQIKTNSCDTFFYGSQYILRSRKMRARSKSFGSLALGRAAKKSEQYRKNKNLHSLKVDFSIYLVSTFNPSSFFCLALLCCRFYESFNRRTSRSS